jgi:hypothetical protein
LAARSANTVSGDNIWLAVAVQISDCHRVRSASSGRKSHDRIECAIASAQQDSDVSVSTLATAACGRAVHHDDIELSVTVHVSGSNRGGAKAARRISDHLLERSVAVANKHADITLIDGDARTAVRDHDVGYSNATEISNSNSIGIDSARIVDLSRVKCSVAVAKRHSNRARSASWLSALVPDHGIKFAVSVHITYSQRESNEPSRIERHFLTEGPVAIAEQDATTAAIRTISRDDDVVLAIAVNIINRGSDGTEPTSTERDTDHRLECAITVTKQDASVASGADALVARGASAVHDNDVRLAI